MGRMGWDPLHSRGLRHERREQIANPVCTTIVPGATCVQNADCGPNALCAAVTELLHAL